MCHKLLMAFLALVVMVGICSIVFFCKALMRPPAIPYLKSNQLFSDISHLPTLGNGVDELKTSDWDKYVLVAQRMKVTSSNVIESALQNTFSSGQLGYSLDRKEMLLLRVCIVCPPGLRQTNTFGGWLSFSAQHSKKIIRDMNWPVRKSFGQFTLEDTLDGYIGKPYDPVAEFYWRRLNGRWRDF